MFSIVTLSRNDRACRTGMADVGKIRLQPGLDQRQSGISQRIGKLGGDRSTLAGQAWDRRYRSLLS